MPRALEGTGKDVQRERRYLVYSVRLGLPALIGGSIGRDRSLVRVIAIAATLCCLLGCIPGIMSLRKREI